MSLVCGATRPESGLRPAPGNITLCRSKSSPRSESCGGECSRSGGDRDVKGVGWKMLRDRHPRGKGVEGHLPIKKLLRSGYLGGGPTGK